jgi:hypothetical protein
MTHRVTLDMLYYPKGLTVKDVVRAIQVTRSNLEQFKKLEGTSATKYTVYPSNWVVMPFRGTTRVMTNKKFCANFVPIDFADIKEAMAIVDRELSPKRTSYTSGKVSMPKAKDTK